MKISVNGESREIAAGNVAALIEELQLSEQATLVEHNGLALRRDEWSRAIADGDHIELLRIVSGG